MRSGVFNLSAKKNGGDCQVDSDAAQTELPLVLETKRRERLVVGVARSAPARNKSEWATRFAVIKAPWLCPVTPMRSGSAMPSRTASSTAALASATSCSKYVS